jgi:hypothetical protein
MNRIMCKPSHPVCAKILDQTTSMNDISEATHMVHTITVGIMRRGIMSNIRRERSQAVGLKVSEERISIEKKSTNL